MLLDVTDPNLPTLLLAGLLGVLVGVLILLVHRRRRRELELDDKAVAEILDGRPKEPGELDKKLLENAREEQRSRREHNLGRELDQAAAERRKIEAELLAAKRELEVERIKSAAALVKAMPRMDAAKPEPVEKPIGPGDRVSVDWSTNYWGETRYGRDEGDVVDETATLFLVRLSQEGSTTPKWFAKDKVRRARRDGGR